MYFRKSQILQLIFSKILRSSLNQNISGAYCKIRGGAIEHKISQKFCAEVDQK